MCGQMGKTRFHFILHSVAPYMQFSEMVVDVRGRQASWTVHMEERMLVMSRANPGWCNLSSVGSWRSCGEGRSHDSSVAVKSKFDVHLLEYID